QYAIPIGGGDGPSRPVAPTGQLQRRPADFSLGRLFGGGGATDYWDIPADLQFQLLQRYRELAEREVRLGRYRRAAYIYGELLNDLNSAASTLVKGGHYREAAVLYRDRLHRPLEAAQCLEQGGLLHEAIAIYETLERYETVGDLYSELEEDELAEEAYRKHVEACKQRGDFLAATKALDEKLHVPEEALVLVKENWRNSSLRRECLLKSFELMGRLGRHDEATEQVQLLRGGLFPSNLTMPVVEGLSEVALTYPEREVCDRAEDATRVVVSKAVIEEQGLNSQLFQILEKLTPEDRLLPRDTKRYLRPKPVKLTRSPSISRRPPPNRGKANTVIAHIKKRGRLPGSVEWRCLETSRDAFHALGTSPRSEGMLGSGKPGGVMLASGQLEDLTRDHVIRWPERETEGRPVLMAVDEADRTTTIHILANTLTIQEPQDSIDRQIIAGTPGWLKANTFGLASCSGVTWAVEIPEFSLKGFDRSGVPLANRQLLPPQDMVFHTLEGERSIVPMHAREEMVYIGLGALLYSVSRKNDLRQIDVGGQILSIVGSQKYTRPRIAAFFEYGGVVVWPSLGEGLVTALSGELIHPQGVFLRDGALVIYSESGWQMYETARGRLTWKGDIEGITLTPTGLFSTRNPNELGVWNEDGTIVIYSLSR
ncbi:MAG: hypothetical protein KDA80_03920, partial [Planctomycetaceae bacterium]|nr:hypothetical protein [Planctomycetaceae bacterium]